jgi:hypothetical protein
MSKLEQAAEGAGVTILCEMGLDPGIGNYFQHLELLGELVRGMQFNVDDYKIEINIFSIMS